jgi:hypothetical protein
LVISEPSIHKVLGRLEGFVEHPSIYTSVGNNLWVKLTSYFFNQKSGFAARATMTD